MTEKVRCIECGKFKFAEVRGKPTDLGKQGFGNCAFSIDTRENHSATFVRNCAKFAPLSADNVASRVQWLNERREVKRKEMRWHGLIR